MINADMRNYDYYTFGEPDEYGQPQLKADESGQPIKQGKIKIAVYNSSQSVQDNVLYLNCQYVGITLDKGVNDKYVIQYGDERLKVLYVSKGRFRRVFMARMG